MDAFSGGLHDQEHSDEADCDREPAPSVDVLAEQGHGERGHDEWPSEGNRNRVGEQQEAHRSEKEEKSTDAAQSANPVSAELRRAHERESTHQGKRGDENQSNDGAAYSENLERIFQVQK